MTYVENHLTFVLFVLCLTYILFDLGILFRGPMWLRYFILWAKLTGADMSSSQSITLYMELFTTYVLGT